MDATNVELGVCEVFVDGASVGHTIGGVTVTYTPEYHETKVDKFGSTNVEKFLIGEKLTAKVPLAEFTLTNIKNAIPFGTVSGGKITIGSVAGKRASENASQLVLHPVANADSDRSDDVVMYKAVQTGEIVIEHKNDGEKILECMYEALVDESRDDGNLLGLIGDSTT